MKTPHRRTWWGVFRFEGRGKGKAVLRRRRLVVECLGGGDSGGERPGIISGGTAEFP